MQIVHLLRRAAVDVIAASASRPLVNARDFLAGQLAVERRIGPLEAAELAEKWLRRFIEEIEEQLRTWDAAGVPRPLVAGGHLGTFLTPHHAKYASSDADRLAVGFFQLRETIRALSPRQFLLVPVLLLYGCGCDPILITDRPGDGGVDCVGRISNGPLRSMHIFAQAKTSTTAVSRDVLAADFGKYCESAQMGGKLEEYAAALSSVVTSDGYAKLYVFVANNEFDPPAVKFAKSSGILIRSAIQCAYILTSLLGYRRSARAIATYAHDPLPADMTRNYAAELRRVIG